MPYTPTVELARPIFVLGTQRSGTTLLRLLLDSHEHIAIGHETGFMRAVKHTKQIPDYEYGNGWYRRYGVSDEEMNARLRDFYSSIFSQHARGQGKQRWGEKTPLNIFHLADMVEIFPDAQFVTIVRHPGAVAASLLRWRFDMERAIAYWLTANRRLRRMGRKIGPQRFHLCRYEDLLLRPRETLKPMLHFLGEPWSDNLLRHHEVHAARAATCKVEGGTRSDRPLDPSRLDDWRTVLDEEQLARLRDARLQPLLRHFGYLPDTARPAA